MIQEDQRARKARAACKPYQAIYRSQYERGGFLFVPIICLPLCISERSRTSANTHQSDNDNHRRHINNHSVSVRTVPRFCQWAHPRSTALYVCMRQRNSRANHGLSRPSTKAPPSSSIIFLPSPLFIYQAYY